MQPLSLVRRMAKHLPSAAEEHEIDCLVEIAANELSRPIRSPSAAGLAGRDASDSAFTRAMTRAGRKTRSDFSGLFT